jgi:hypothetical protein
VLTAGDPESASWRTPGLHYDPSIKFWTGSSGSATIAPGTWGFVVEPEGNTDPIIVYVTSSLETPPPDSRFGLYVGAAVHSPVTVQVVGESQIQGLDGVLGASAALVRGADYEWVFYHDESGASVWGLVSDTAGLAKRFPAPWESEPARQTMPIQQTDEPPDGAVLTYVASEGGGHVSWADLQLKADWSGYPLKATPTAADIGLIQDAAAGGAISRAAWSVGGGGSSWSVASNINPRHWWRANNVVATGGLADTIVDNGRIPKNFTASGTLRAAVAVDGNGKTNLDFNGAQCYAAGVVADWPFLHNGVPWTLLMVCTGVPAALSSPRYILSTGGDDGANTGIVVQWSKIAGVNMTLSALFLRNVMGAMYADKSYDPKLRVMAVRHAGYTATEAPNNGWFTSGWGLNTSNRAPSLWLRDRGMERAAANYVNAYVTGNPTTTLLLGAGFATGQYGMDANVYEVLIEDRLLSEADVLAYEAYARAQYAVPG